MTLENGSINSRSNNLNFIRLLAAISVTFGHSFAMTHGSHYELIFGVNSAAFGFYAVAVFFGLSGFLITQSFFRNPRWKSFLKARLLRLVPGYIFSNFITAILIIFLILREPVLIFSSKFLIYILGGVFKEKHSFPNIFSHLYYNSTNGSQWTLPYEFRMYVITLIAGICGLLKKRHRILLLFIILSVVSIFQIDVIFKLLFRLIFKIDTYDGTYLALPLCFGLGMIAYLFREKITLSLPISIALLVFSFIFNGWLFKTLAWIYFVFCFGYIPKFYIPKLNYKTDLSYGIYVLSWPIQQCVLHFKATDNAICLFFISMSVIVPLAMISWRYVESPCLKLKNNSR